jgi:hypothetical protein
VATAIAVPRIGIERRNLLDSRIPPHLVSRFVMLMGFVIANVPPTTGRGAVRGQRRTGFQFSSNRVPSISRSAAS